MKLYHEKKLGYSKLYLEINENQPKDTSQIKIKNKTETALSISALIIDSINPFSALDSFNVINTLLAFVIGTLYFIVPIQLSKIDSIKQEISGQISEITKYETNKDSNELNKSLKSYKSNLSEMNSTYNYIQRDYIAIFVLITLFVIVFAIFFYRIQRYNYFKDNAYNTSIEIVNYMAISLNVKTRDKEAFLKILEKKLTRNFFKNPYWIRFKHPAWIRPNKPTLSLINKDLIYGIACDWEASLGKPS